MRPILPFRLGKLELYFLSDGEIWLDGGSTFGTVPKVLWSKLTEPDAQNRIRLGLNPLLIRYRERWILVETGIDRKPGEKFRAIYHLTPENPVLGQLTELGVWPQDIDWVIHTHLHFDHAGLNTSLVDGKLVRTFPKARHLVQKQELWEATHLHERNQASYRAENLERIEFETVEGEAELLPGLRVVPVPGHTLGMQAVELESEGQRLALPADLIPTMMQAPLPYIMAFDLYPMTTLETRKAMYKRWLEGGYQLGFVHEPGHPVGKLVLGEKGYRAEPLNP